MTRGEAKLLRRMIETAARGLSDLDANVWEPGVYGWTEVTE